MAEISQNSLKALIGAGNDAFANIYTAEFSGGLIGTTNLGKSFTVRCKGFSVPEVKQDSYTVKFMNTKLDRPVSKIDVTRHFSLTFRVDANFEIYKKLLQQQSIFFNVTNDSTNTDIKDLANNLFTVTLKTTDKSSSETLSSLRFKKCWITSITPSGWSSENSAPLEVTVDISYLELSDLNYLLG